MNTHEMTAIVLAGGKSSRMGRDKIAVPFDGKPLLARTVEALAPLFGEVVIVTNQDIPFDVPGTRVIRDEVPHQGPLGGISAGLKAAAHDIGFVVAVDMPFISPDVIDFMAGFAGGADVVLPMTANGLEPLFAFYNRRCVAAIDEALAHGDRKILMPLTRLDIKVIGYKELAGLPGAEQTFINVNTERELEEAQAIAAHSAAPQSREDLRTPIERAFTIFVNSEELVTVQSSMEHLDELACGFLVSEGILQDRDDLESVRVDDERGEVRVRTKSSKSMAARSMGKRFITSGCGKGFSFVSLGDAMGIAPLTSTYSVAKDTIPPLMKEFLRASGRPGMHSSAVVRGGEISLIRQDIGRHNTVDMILGKMWLDGMADRDIMLFTTGRISYEMVVKAAKARIPILVSRTAATDLAVRLATRIGIEVVGYVRAGNMKVYTDGSRLKSGKMVTQ